MIFPIPNKSVGNISSGFGNRVGPVSGVEEFHNGIDIPAPKGSAIVSPVNGEVVAVESNSRGGNQFFIKGDNGFTYGFAHCDEVQVRTGDVVMEGQQVALVGSTGSATGPHLHWTIRNAQGTLLNPSKEAVNYRTISRPLAPPPGGVNVPILPSFRSIFSSWRTWLWIAIIIALVFLVLRSTGTTRKDGLSSVIKGDRQFFGRYAING